jgi:hypothetical protein
MVLNVVEEIQHWAVLRPAAFFTCQLTQIGMRIQQAHPYPPIQQWQEYKSKMLLTTECVTVSRVKTLGMSGTLETSHLIYISLGQCPFTLDE